MHLVVRIRINLLKYGSSPWNNLGRYKCSEVTRNNMHRIKSGELSGEVSGAFTPGLSRTVEQVLNGLLNDMGYWVTEQTWHIICVMKTRIQDGTAVKHLKWSIFKMVKVYFLIVWDRMRKSFSDCLDLGHGRTSHSEPISMGNNFNNQSQGRGWGQPTLTCPLL